MLIVKYSWLTIEHSTRYPAYRKLDSSFADEVCLVAC